MDPNIYRWYKKKDHNLSFIFSIHFCLDISRLFNYHGFFFGSYHSVIKGLGCIIILVDCIFEQGIFPASPQNKSYQVQGHCNWWGAILMQILSNFAHISRQYDMYKHGIIKSNISIVQSKSAVKQSVLRVKWPSYHAMLRSH